MTGAVATGFLTGLSLILAIGAQNAFVLRQGLMRRHVFAVALACALSDAALIAAGVGGMGWLVTAVPWLIGGMRWAGAAFLTVYGAMAFRSAWAGHGALRAAEAGEATLARTLAVCLALTWLNPHVYLDTVVLLGSISTRFAADRWLFGLGAMAASFAFFFALAYGARVLAPLFARASAWRLLDLLVGAVMWTIALTLVRG